MTNLVVLALMVATNWCEFRTGAQMVTNGPYAGMAVEIFKTNRICCVSTRADMGLPDGRYLFSSYSTDRPCEGWNSGSVSMELHEEGVGILKRKTRPK